MTTGTGGVGGAGGPVPAGPVPGAEELGTANLAGMDLDMMLMLTMRDYKKVNEDNAARVFEDMQANIKATQQLNAELKMWGELKAGTGANADVVAKAETLFNTPGVDTDNDGMLSKTEVEAAAASSDPKVAAAGQHFKDNPEHFNVLQGGAAKGKQDDKLSRGDLDGFKNGKVDDSVKEQINPITQGIQAKIDALNSVNQLKMLALQKAQGNVTQAMESMSSSMKKSDDTKMAIIRNS